MPSADGAHGLVLIFTDIEGSSQLWEAHGDGFMKAHEALLTGLCQDLGGRFIKNEGDAFFLVFAAATAALRWA